MELTERFYKRFLLPPAPSPVFFKEFTGVVQRYTELVIASWQLDSRPLLFGRGGIVSWCRRVRFETLRNSRRYSTKSILEQLFETFELLA